MKTGFSLMRSVRLRQPLTWFGWLVFWYVTLTAIAHPALDFDSWAYHLPFARGVWGLPRDPRFDLPAALHFLFVPNVYYYALGFPKVAETFQGLFWILTGRVNGVMLPQIILFVFYMSLIKDYFRIPISILAVASFACPLIYIHYEAAYIDLFSNLNFVLAFFLLSKFLQDLGRVPLSWNRPLIFGCGTLVLAANSKTTTLVLCLFLLASVVIRVALRRGVLLPKKVGLIGLLLGVGLICSGVPIKNLIRYGNPVYPIEIKLGLNPFLAGPVPQYHQSPQYRFPILNWPPVSFLLSATEMDFAVRGVTGVYNIDANAGDHPRFDHPARTGGFGGFYFSILGAVFAAGLFHVRRIADPLLRSCLIQGGILILFTSFLPQSFELRYWLFVPMLIVPVCLKLAMLNRHYFRLAKALVFLIFLYNAGLVYLSYNPGAL